MALTTITDNILEADDTAPPAGSTLVIKWPRFTSTDKKTIAAGSFVIPISATDGSFTISLEPSDTATPAFSYLVEYRIADGRGAFEAWIVPTSAAVQTVANLWVSEQTQVAGSGLALRSLGDLVTFGAGQVARLMLGSDGQILTADRNQPTGIKWANPFASPLTSKGDLYIRAASGDGRVAVGSDGQVLLADTTRPEGLRWGTPSPITFLGDWNAATTYNVGEAVARLGGSYINQAAGNLNKDPSTTTGYWGQLAAAGGASNLATQSPLSPANTGAVGVSNKAAREDHVHPTSTAGDWTVGGAIKLTGDINGGILPAGYTDTSGYSFAIVDEDGRIAVGMDTAGVLSILNALLTNPTLVSPIITGLVAQKELGVIQDPATDLSGYSFAIVDEDGAIVFGVDGTGKVSAAAGGTLAGFTLPNATLTSPTVTGLKVGQQLEVTQDAGDLSGYSFAIVDEDNVIGFGLDATGGGGSSSTATSTATRPEVVDTPTFTGYSATLGSQKVAYFEDKATSTKRLVQVPGDISGLRPSSDGSKLIFASSQTDAVNKALYFNPTTGLIKPVFPYQIISSYGDSLLGAGATDPGHMWPNLVAAYFGLTSQTNGVGGQLSTQIAARQGGYPLIVSATGNVIPASGSVVLTAINTQPITTQNASAQIYGTLRGVYGYLTSDGAGGAYTFTRTVAGSSVACPAGSTFVVDTFGQDNNIQLLWMGQNGADAGRIEVDDIQACIDFLKPLAKRYLVVGNMYNKVKYDRIRAAFAGHHIDARMALFAANGTPWDGVTWPSPETDTTSPWYIPAQFRADSIHLVNAGHQVIANEVIAEIIKRNWV